MPKRGATPRPNAKSGKRRVNQNTALGQQRRAKVKTLSTEAANAVGRPGFGGTIPGPVDGKSKVRILNSDADPASGLASKAAGKITTSGVDLVGPQNPKVLSTTNVNPPTSGQRVVRPPRQSAPVRSNSPGKVTRPRSR
jgi:hypothetical protein